MFAYPLTLRGEEPHNYAAGPGVGPVRPIFALPHMTPLPGERHNRFSHIIPSAAHGKGIRSRFKLGKRGLKPQVGTGAAKAAA